MSETLFIFKKKRLAKYQSLLLIILFASIFIIPFSLAAQTKGVIINPPGTGGSGLSVTGNFTYYLNATGSTYNATYHHAARFGYNMSDASYARIMNNDSYLTTYNATYQTWLPNYTLYSAFWYNMSDGSYNATYHAYNTSTGLAGYYVPYTGALHNVNLKTYSLNASSVNATYFNAVGTGSFIHADGGVYAGEYNDPTGGHPLMQWINVGSYWRMYGNWRSLGGVGGVDTVTLDGGWYNGNFNWTTDISNSYNRFNGTNLFE